MTEKPESIIKSAMEMAEELPEKYQVVAFAELLRHALGSESVSKEPGTGAPPRAGPSPPADDTGWQELARGLPGDFVVKERGSRDQQTVWAVIKVCSNHEEATPEAVCRTIRTALSKKPEHEKNATNRLGRLTPKYLKRERRQDGKGFAYAPTDKALEIFEGLAEGA